MTLCLIRPRRRKLMTRIRLRYLDAACRACEAKTEACGDLGRLTPVKSPLFPTGGAAASAVGFAFGTAAAASGPTPSGSQHTKKSGNVGNGSLQTLSVFLFFGRGLRRPVAPVGRGGSPVLFSCAGEALL